MKLQAVTIQTFRNFVEAQRVVIEDDVTCLVGKNESGKTTVLKALHRLNPANGDSKTFDLVTEYPRWRLSRDRRDNASLVNTNPVVAEFSLEDDDIAALTKELPAAPLPTTQLFAARSYANSQSVWVETPVEDIVRAAAEAAAVEEPDLEQVLNAGTLDAAVDVAKVLSKDLKESHAARSKALAAFPAQLEIRRFLRFPNKLEQEQRDALWARVPKFFYFSNYSTLPGESDLTALAGKISAGEVLVDREQTVVSLLRHAGVGPSDFLDNNYESRKAELQAASKDLSTDVFKYWKANKDLTVVFGDDNISVVEPATGQPANHRILKIELRDARHGDVETNFATRSSGFQWFFSFFAAFSEYLHSAKAVVVLLDEPGTSLHGEAQKDFIDYIFNVLGASKQTIYTTHSQFMIDPTRYEKLRAVHDKATREDQEAGVAVTQVSLSADRDTILPVESALGYSVSQHLFLGSGHHLLVEGSSDFIFISRMSAYMESKGRTYLDPRLAIIPVGGITNMPAFVALMGRRLEVSVLVDGEKTSAVLDRTRNAADANGVDRSRIVSVGEVEKGLPTNSDIEDLFAPIDYIRLYNWAERASFDAGELSGQGRVIEQIASVAGTYKHALEAHALVANQQEFFDSISPVSVDRFEKLFVKLNGTLA